MTQGTDLQSMFADPALLANPFPVFEQLRAAGLMRITMPFGPQEQTTWIVTRFADAVQVLKDRRFVVNPASVYGDMSGTAQGVEDMTELPGFLQGRSMASADEPDHTRLRTLVSRAFTPRYVESLRPRIQQIADALLDQVDAQGNLDIVDDYAFPLPITVISEMLGVPHADRDQIRAWSGAVAGGSYRQPNSVWMDQMVAFARYVRQLVASKRQSPEDDLISQLIEIEEAGDRLSEQELVDMIGLLIFAGHETTSNLIAIGTLMLFDHPEQLQRLKADLSLIPAAVEELLRFHAPVSVVAPRYATEAVEIGGQIVNKGDALLLLLASANRDESAFDSPGDLDITRALNRHIGFGHGVHYCLGSPLARLEADIAFTTLLRRMPKLRLDIPREQVAWRGDMFLRGLVSLPVAF